MFIIYDDLSRQTNLLGEQVQLMTDLRKFFQSTTQDRSHPNATYSILTNELMLHN